MRCMFLVESLTLVWISYIAIPSTCLLYWLANVDPTQICMRHLASVYGVQLPFFVELMVVTVYLWGMTGINFIALCSITRLLLYAAIGSFWSQFGTQEES